MNKGWYENLDRKRGCKKSETCTRYGDDIRDRSLVEVNKRGSGHQHQKQGMSENKSTPMLE